MAINCPRCGAGFDVTLFQFGHAIRCDCGARVEMDRGHVLEVPADEPTTAPDASHVQVARAIRAVPSNSGPRKEGSRMAEEEIGKVTHYFGKISVAAIELTKGSLSVGDKIHIKGHTSDFYETIDSMQIDNKPVETAEPGQAIGIKVVEHAREHDTVYKVTE
jgi:hypothetical protein